VIPDREHVAFMYSYPNLIPLAEREVRTIATKLKPYRFERILGAWWNRIVPRDGHEIVQRSAERHARAVRGQYPPGA